MEKTVRVFEVLFDGPEDGPAGPAGDGTFVYRTRLQKDAERFAKGSTTYGRPATVQTNDVPRRLAQRWGARMKIVLDDLWLCVDCLMVAVNDDASGIEDEYRVRAVRTGVASLGPHLVPDFDSETGEGIDEFSCCGCDACGSHLAGTMHRFAVLGEDCTPKTPPRGTEAMRGTRVRVSS